MRTLALLVPSVNERSLPDVLAAIPGSLGGWQTVVTVSGAGFGDAPSRFPAIRFIERSPDARGVGSSVRRGFADALALDADAVVKLDGDRQCDPRVLPRFLKAFDVGATFVVASRYREKPDEAPPVDRRLLSLAFTAAVNRITGWTLTDAVSGYFGCTLPVIRACVSKLETNGYGIGLELLLRHWASGGTVTEIAYQSNYRHGNGKFETLYAAASLSVRVERAAIYLRVLSETLTSLGLARCFSSASGEQLDFTPRTRRPPTLSVEESGACGLRCGGSAPARYRSGAANSRWRGSTFSLLES